MSDRGKGFGFDDIGGLKQGIGDIPVEHMLRQYGAMRDQIAPTDLGPQIVYAQSDSTTITLANATNTNITHQAGDVVYDPFKIDDAPNNQYVIPQSIGGMYLAIAYAEFASNSTGRRQMRFRLNSGNTPMNLVSKWAPPVSGAAGGWIIELMELQAGDVIQVEGFQNSGGNLDIQQNALMLIRFGAIRATSAATS